MKTARQPAVLSCRKQLTRLLILLVIGAVAIFCVARFAVPAIYPVRGSVRTRFSSGTAMPGAAARPGLHFGAIRSDFDRTCFLYLRIGSKVWLLEIISPIEQ